MAEFYLKILSGNHIGAEIPIESGKYELGKDDNCDLVLSDDNINGKELVIEIFDDGRIEVQACNADTTLFLNGEAVGTSIQYSYFDIITSSNLFLAIGPSDQEWPTLTLPNISPPVNQELAVSDSEQTDSEESSSDILPTDFEQELSESDLDEDEDDGEDDDDDSIFELPIFLANIHKRWLAVIPAILVLVVVSIIILSSSNDQPHVERTLNSQQIDSLVRKQLGLKDLVFKQLPDQTLLISGYTRTLQDKIDMQKFIRKQGLVFNSQVVAMSEMRDTAESILLDLGYSELQLELDTNPGSLVVTGYVATADEFDDIVTVLKNEIYGLISIVDQVENQVDRVNTLKSMLREKGLIPRINVIVKDKTVILKGHLLDEGQVFDLNTVVTKFQKKYDNNPLIELATKYAGGSLTENHSPLLLDIRGVSMGKVPYVVLMDGSKYLIGAKLSDRYIIEDINLEYLLLFDGTERFKYRLGGNRGGQIKN